MRSTTASFVLLAITFAASVVARQPGLRHVRRSGTAVDRVPAVGDPLTNTGIPSGEGGLGGTFDPNSVAGSQLGGGGGVRTGSDTGIDVGGVPGSGVHDHIGGGGGGGGKHHGADGKDSSQTTPPVTDSVKTDQPGLLGGEDDKSTPLPVTHSDYGAYPNSGSAFQQFYAFSPWVYVSSMVATGPQNGKQPVAPVITLGVCRCERPFGSIADAQGSDKMASYGNSACLANVVAASSTSAQCHDAGIDQKQCVENGVPGQLADGDKLWWQKTFCKRCVDAGGVSDPQFACFDNYLNTGLAQGGQDGTTSAPAGQDLENAGGSQ